jgi:histidinol-phosphate/aromatic aminotransferase/cobyric acid decarboxylase-like protein
MSVGGAIACFSAAIAAQESLMSAGCLDPNRANYKEICDYARKEFDKLGIKYANPGGDYICFWFGMKDKDLLARLKTKNILISDARESGVPEGAYCDWARVSIGTREDIDLFRGEMTKIMGKT